MTSLPNILGLTLTEVENFALQMGEPRFRGNQIYSGVFKHQQAFNDFSNVSKKFKAQLCEHFCQDLPRIDQVQVSKDGTRKYGFVDDKGSAFEAVYIPEVAKGSTTNTLCISSQTGCAVGCKFCFTASIRRNRDLTAAEIVGQVMAVQKDVAPLGEDARITNIVFMGMGEPLLNYDNVIQAIRILLDRSGLDFSSRRITVSTSGIVPRIYDLGRDVPTQLAISLNATTDDTRTRIMPINKKWPLAELLKALKAYPLHPRRKITIEYVMLAGINDSLEDAKRLVKLLDGIPSKINLLPLNGHDRTEFSSPSANQVQRFQDELWRLGYKALRRTQRGADISAACGMLGETVATQKQAV